MASATGTSATGTTTTTDPILRVGNLRFCNGCQNLMYARAENDLLTWICSIECPFSLATEATPLMEGERLVVLSQTTDSDFTHNQNPHNQFTKFDPTLLRTSFVCPNKTDPTHSDSPEKETEMIIFKQNIVTANSYYICTRCNRNISLERELL